MTLQSDIGADEFMSDLNGMDSFIYQEVPSKEEEDVWQELYQGLPDSPDMDDVMDQEILKILLTPMISFLTLMYVYLMKKE